MEFISLYSPRVLVVKPAAFFTEYFNLDHKIS